MKKYPQKFAFQIFSLSLGLVLFLGCTTPSEQNSPQPSEEISSCNCYYTHDCGSWGTPLHTDHSILLCERNWGSPPVCSEDNFEDGSKYLDGVCQNIVLPPGKLPMVATALDLWLQAFEKAGVGGGVPDKNDLTKIHELPLTAREQAAIQSLVVHMLSLSVGLTSYPDTIPHALGYFTLPTSRKAARPSSSPDNVGSMTMLPKHVLGVQALIRQVVINELTSSHPEEFSRSFSNIRKRFPKYHPFARCEYPHPPSHGHVFPYPDGLACLQAEIWASIQAIRGGNVSLKGSGK